MAFVIDDDVLLLLEDSVLLITTPDNFSVFFKFKTRKKNKLQNAVE